jgi:hypothetical protein
MSQRFIGSNTRHLQQQDVGGVSEKRTVKVPRLSENAGTYELLTFIREFQQACSIMSWTTGPRLYKKFEVHLQGFHRQTWTDEAAGLAQTVVTFDTTVRAFKSQLLEDEDYDNQLDFIRELKKPRDMKPGTFLLYF